MDWISTYWSRWGAVFWLVVLLLTQWIVQQNNALDTSLRYDRELLTGEFWRSFSYIFVHTNTTHFLLNASALVAMFVLFRPAFRSSVWFMVFILCSVSSSLGLYIFNPSVGWLVGMSGPLHGLLVYTLLRAHAHWSLPLILAFKLAIEQIPTLQSLVGLDYTSELINAEVVVDSHLWGAIGGIIVFLMIRSIVWFRLAKELANE
jgi:rhomboid family GlyGly-CTERM serine protease